MLSQPIVSSAVPFSPKETTILISDRSGENGTTVGFVPGSMRNKKDGG